MGGPVALEAARRLGGRVKTIIGTDTLNNVSIPFPEAQLNGMLADGGRFSRQLRAWCEAVFSG